MSNQNDENTNSYNYNPNRPQSQNEIDHSSTKKVSDTAAKGAAEYLAPGVGGKIYDASKNVPGIGDAIDNATSNIAKTADKIPGVSKTTEALDKSGAVDAVNSGIDMIGGKPQGMNKGTKSTSSGIAPSANTTISQPYRKNMDFSHRMNEQEVLEENSETQSSDLSDTEDLQSAEMGTSDLQNDFIHDEDSSKNESQSKGGFDGFGNFRKLFIKKHSILIIGSGIAAFFILLLFLVLMGGSNESNQQGYYDTACNFNDTRVNFVSCDASDSELYGTFSIDEFVEKISYAYIKDDNYSDEAIKALMVVLKTNAFSYGGYNSSSKNIDVRSCDILTYYEEADIDSILNSTESELEHLKELYSSISEYLFLSSSYQSSISSLNSLNSLTFSNEKLEEFEVLANDGLDYSDILSSIYSSGDDDSSEIVYRDTLYIGDSRMQGILNAGYINNTNTVYGVGYGYNWFVGNGTIESSKTNATSGAISGIQSKMKDGASYNIVIWLGINDLETGANTYYQKYYELASGDWKNHQVYIVSVGPVDDTKTIYAKNDAIDDFNQDMKTLIQDSGLSNLNYIDLNYSPEYYDSEGLHYNNNDYKNIYQIISQNVVSELSTNLTLYRLSDYCIYYNVVTKNKAYWWPVGSATATNGNIYGGTPVSVNITSTFGPRIHPITGKFQSAHGAIDIGVVRNTPVIATKDGKVNFTNEGCSEGNYSCGGGYGNYIKIEHEDGIESLYAHLNKVLVNVEDSVVQGQIIGYSGSTGSSSGPHLHFEIRLNGVRVDPINYVNVENPRPVEEYNLLADSDGGATPAENKTLICQSLKNSGFSDNAVAGMLVNIAAEGSFKTTNLENCYEEGGCCKNSKGNNYGYCVHPELKGFGSDSLYTAGVDSGDYSRDKFMNDSAGYGLVQWTDSGRKAKLYDYVKSKNKSIGSLSAQLGYLLEEIEEYAVTYKYITGNYTASEISTVFCKNFEGPSGSNRTDLTATDTCTARTDNYISSMLQYVKNGCKE